MTTAKLFEALESGKKLVKDYKKAFPEKYGYNDTGEFVETIELEINKQGRYLWRHGWGSAIGSDKDVLLELVKHPEYWSFDTAPVSAEGGKITGLSVLENADPYIKEKLTPKQIQVLVVSIESAMSEYAAQQDSRVKELENVLRNSDEVLQYFEDFTHGNDGTKITQCRKQIQQALK